MFLILERLFLPPFATERLLPSHCNWEFKITFVPSDFVTLVGQPEESETVREVKLMIEKFEMDFHRIQLSEKADYEFRTNLQRNGSLSIPFMDYSIQSFQVTDGVQMMTTPTATVTGYPRRMILFMGERRVNKCLNQKLFSSRERSIR